MFIFLYIFGTKQKVTTTVQLITSPKRKSSSLCFVVDHVTSIWQWSANLLNKLQDKGIIWLECMFKNNRKCFIQNISIKLHKNDDYCSETSRSTSIKINVCRLRHHIFSTWSSVTRRARNIFLIHVIQMINI